MPGSVPPVVPLIELISALSQFRHLPVPGYSVFLGAGASKSSGLPLAMELAEDALLERYTLSEGAPPADEPVAERRERLFGWMRKQSWFVAHDNLYGVIMEGTLPNAGLRQAFLERRFANARPSSGYRRLGDLLQARIVDTIFTTNFESIGPAGCVGSGNSNCNECKRLPKAASIAL